MELVTSGRHTSGLLDLGTTPHLVSVSLPTLPFLVLTNTDILVLANAALFVIAITGYKYWVRNENKKLEAGGEAAESTKRFGVTDQQIKLGWRYEGYEGY